MEIRSRSGPYNANSYRSVPSTAPGAVRHEVAALGQGLDVVADSASALAGELYGVGNRYSTVLSGKFQYLDGQLGEVAENAMLAIELSLQVAFFLL